MAHSIDESPCRRQLMWIGAVLFWFLCLPVWSHGCVPDSVPLARARLKAGDLPGADRIVRSGLKKHADSVDLWVLRLRIDLLRTRRADAVVVVRRLRDLATWREWKHVRRMVFAHTIWEALGDERARVMGLAEARRYRFSSLAGRLRDLMAHGGDLERAMAAGALLHKIAGSGSVLARLAASRDDRVRMEVARGLRGPWTEALWKLVLRLADDSDSEVRAAALQSVADSGIGGGKSDRWSMRIVDLMASHLRDPSGTVRSVAAHTLGKAAPSMLSHLALADSELAVRLAAFEAGGRDRAYLTAQVHSGRPFVALRAAVMLWKEGFVGGDDVVLRLMGDGQWQVRAAACHAASAMKGSEKACRAVRRVFEDRDRMVRAAACSAGLYMGCERRKAETTCRRLASGRDLAAAASAWELARRGRRYGVDRLDAIASRPGAGRIAAMRFLASLGKGLSAVMSCWQSGPWSCRLEAARLLYDRFRRPSGS